MAKIIETTSSGRRTIKLSVDDIFSVIREYQRTVPRFTSYENTRNFLEDTAIFIPEDL